MNKKKRSVSVRNAEAITRASRYMPMPMIPNAPSAMPQGTAVVNRKPPTRRSKGQSLLVIRDPPLSLPQEQGQEQDDIIIVHDEEFKNLSDSDDSVICIASSRADNCEAASFRSNTSRIGNVSATGIANTRKTSANTSKTSANTRKTNANTRKPSASSKDKRKPLEKYLEERRLIRAVHKRRVLYDSTHRRFNDRDFKYNVWRSIARRLSMDMANCIDIWSVLRHEFQCHTRKMYNYKRKMTQSRAASSRPFMAHEEEMCFLYPHVASYPLLRQKTRTPAEPVSAPQTEKVVVPVNTAQLVAIIDLDLDEDHFRITANIRRLIEAVRFYPQLYDAAHMSYNDYRHRGLIWGAISNELGEKATKLMKIWLTLQTRYEWEMNHPIKAASELMKLMTFLIPHMPHMKESVYKTSKYLITAWHDPIEQFRGVMTLVNVLKSRIELIQLTDEYLHQKSKPSEYDEQWQRVATLAMSTPERCEVTWLVLRSFHNELIEMRLASYKLQDKWYFESSITTIYRMLVERTVNREGRKLDLSNDPNKRTPMVRVALMDGMTDESQNPAETPPRMPLAIVYPSAIVFSAPTTTTNSWSMSSSTPTVPTVPTKTTSISSNSATTRPTATIATSTVSSSTASTGIRSDGVKYVNALTMVGPNNQLKMVTNAVPLVPNGNPVPKVFVIRRKVPLPPTTAPGCVIRPGVTMPTPVLRSPAPPIIEASNWSKINVPRPPTNGRATAAAPPPKDGIPMTLIAGPGGTLKRKRTSNGLNHSSNSNGHSSTDTASETASPSNNMPLPAIANTRLQMQIINNISVEFLENPTRGNTLHIYGGALNHNYSMNMMRVAMMIREVMAIPILHNSNPKLASKKSEYWGNVARKFHMPADACLATWKFLSENISLFPAIAPMSDLMSPSKSYPKCWDRSDRLFSKFKAIANKNNWIKIKDKLSLLMMHFRMYEHLYSDMRRPRPGEIIQPRYTTKEQHDDVWRVAKTKFPDIKHMEIWSTFKYTFRTYMDELELGIDNSWPCEWWTVFDQLRFLVNVRYHPLEPYYYIVHTKIRKEVKRCSIVEKMMKPAPANIVPKSRVLSSRVSIDWEPLPWDTEEAKRLLTGKLRSDKVVPNATAAAPATAPAPAPAPATSSVLVPTPATAAFTATAAAPAPAPTPAKAGFPRPIRAAFAAPAAPPPAKAAFPAPIRAAFPAPAAPPPAKAAFPAPIRAAFPAPAAPPPAKAAFLAPIRATFPAPATAMRSAPAPAPATASSLSLLRPRSLVLIPKGIKVVPEPEEKINGQQQQLPKAVQTPPKFKYKSAERPLPIISAFEVARMLRKYPNTYRRCSTIEKRNAWVQAATELNVSVTDCRLSIQHALRASRTLKIADPTNQCQIGQNYYRHMNEIYKAVNSSAPAASTGQLSVRTPQQLNEKLAKAVTKDKMLVKRFMPEISMSNCEAGLVLKNWSRAVASFSPDSQQKLIGKLTNVFAKHAQASKEAKAKNESNKKQ